MKKDPSDHDLCLLAYVSNSTAMPQYVSHDIADIKSNAALKNPNYNITGVLFYYDGLYLQVIEGPKLHVTTLMETISKDTRHKNIITLLNEPIETRSFDGWEMDCFNLSDDKNINREVLIKISEDFKQSLVPRGDTFVKFYKVMLEH